jgi:hypothetical protein
MEAAPSTGGFFALWVYFTAGLEFRARQKIFCQRHLISLDGGFGQA